MAVVRSATVGATSNVQLVADDEAPALPPYIDRDLMVPPPVTMRDLPNLLRLQGLQSPYSSAPADEANRGYENDRQRQDFERNRQRSEQQRLQWQRLQQR